jgi:hypothetical protein
MLDGLPLTFFVPLVAHALAGLTTVITGILTFLQPKRPGGHHRWGGRYLWAYTVVFCTAGILSVQHWPADAYLLGLATLGYGFALAGYSMRRYRLTLLFSQAFGPWWVIGHLTGVIGSYVVLLTAFYVDNAHLIPLLKQLPTLTFWLAPTLIAIPFLARAITRFAPRRKVTIL